MKHLAPMAALCVAALFGSSLAHSQALSTTPRTITYQGSLQLASGKAAKDSTYNVTVRLYSDETGTKEVWSGTYPVQTMSGVFNVALGSGNAPFPEAAFMDKPLWFGVQIEGNEEMRPLSALSASAFALNVPDKSISASKISADYIKSITINGQTMSGNGRDLNIQTGDGIMASIDEATNSVFLKSTPTINGAKGGAVEGNTTISGSLTVTGSTMLGTGSGTPVYINSLTPGSIPFIGTSNVVAQDNGRLFWDRNNYRLGLLTNTPATTLDVNGGVRFGGSSSDTIAVRSRFTTSLIPKTDSVYNLGDATHYWDSAWINHLTIGPHSLTMSDGSVETQLSMPTGGDGSLAIDFFDVTGGAPQPLTGTPPLQIDQFGMVTTDLQSAAITSGNSIKIDGTNYPRTIQSDDDMNIFADPRLDGGVLAPNALGRKVRLFAGPGGTGANGGDLILASGSVGIGGLSDGTIYFKTGDTAGTTQMYINDNGVTINTALFTTGTFSSSAITPIVYGGTAQNSTLSLLTTNNTSAPTGSITLGGSTGAGTTTFATMNASSVNLGSGIALKTNGTTRISTTGDATFTTLTSSGTANINDAGTATTSINHTSGAGTVNIGNAASTVNVKGATDVAGATTINDAGTSTTSINHTSGAGTVNIGNAASSVNVKGATDVAGATTINDAGTATTSINHTSGAGTVNIGNAASSVNVKGATTIAGVTSINDASGTNAATNINTTSGSGTVSIGNTSTYTLVTGSAEFVGNVLANASPSTATVELGNVGHGGNVNLYSHATITLNANANDINGATTINDAGTATTSINHSSGAGTVNVGNASSSVNVKGTTDLQGATTINKTGNANTEISDGSGTGNVTIGNTATPHLDLHTAAAANNTASGDGSTAIGYQTHALDMHGNATLNTGANDGTTDIGNASKATTITATTTTITSALTTHGTANINTTIGNGATTIGNSSNTLALYGSTVSVNGAGLSQSGGPSSFDDISLNKNAGAGRTINISAADASHNGDALNLTAGAASANDRSGGDIVIGSGAKNGAGADGNITFQTGGNTRASISNAGVLTVGNGATGSIVLNTGGSNDMTLTETTISRSGAIAVNPGTGNKITSDGGMTSAENVTITSGGLTVTAGGATVTAGGITSHGTTSINTTASDGATTIGNASNATDLHANAATVNTASSDGTTSIGYRAHALDIHGNATVNTGTNDGTTDIGNSSKATSITATTTTITSALTTHGVALVNTTVSDGNTSIGNSSNTVGITASTITTNGAAIANGTLTTHGDANINTTSSDGNTSIGNTGNTVGVTASTITVTGALNTHGAATINTTASDGNTSIGNSSNTVGVTASTITATGALNTHGAASINTTLSDGSTSIGNTGNTVGVTASTITVTGALNTHGAATINTTASDGNTSIGNSSNTLGLTASTITATGTTNINDDNGNTTSINHTSGSGTVNIGNSSSTVNVKGATDVTGASTINTSGSATTGIGNATGATTMYGQLVNSYGKDTATYNNTDAVNEVTLKNRSVNYIWGDGNFSATDSLIVTVPNGVDGQIMTVVDVADNTLAPSITFVDSNQQIISSTAFAGAPTKFELVHAGGAWIVF